MASGATPAVVGMFLVRRALTPIGIGGAIGVALSLATTRLLRDQWYGVAPRDVTTLVAVTPLLLVVPVIAVCIPSWRAMHLSPARALAGA